MYNHMVVDHLDQARVDQMFHALGDATRRDIMTRVIHVESSVSALARHYTMSFAAVQKHVAVLERASLVTKERRGREQIVRVNIDAVRRASVVLDQLESVWLHRMDRFGKILAEATHPPRQHRTQQRLRKGDSA